MSTKELARKIANNLKRGYLKYLGILLIVSALTYGFLTFRPLLLAYFSNLLSPATNNASVQITSQDQKITQNITSGTQIIFVDNNFGIYIPKIKANAKVTANVDPTNKAEYDIALQSGVAQAKGSSFPNEHGNLFLFAHSAVNFYEQRKYNVYFYLLEELKKNDPIYISYNNQIYTYEVLETKIINQNETKYMGKYMDKDTLTLMSCWPVGTNWKRIIVTAIRDIQ